ncbi:phosphatase PAP2 family protein [Halovivax sp.]|uniref:phosphatase PAP2 family protein n=1 Tax=Halovivax sp. TaxID=1935978 RepID=UPI0025BEB1D1|nr:phosphatase PAP2 family protein [Halovivax sp.]
MWFDPATVRTVRDAFPEWAAFVFAFFSYLGSVWFVAPAVVLAFYFGPRDRFASWIGIVMGAYAIMVGTKGYFEVDRPGVGPAIAPETLPVGIQHVYAPLVEVSSTSFPSGHAMAGTAIWTMLALETDVGTRRLRLAGGAVLIVAIAVSRIAVGLHYPIDVVAGVAVALAYLVVILWLRERVRAERDARAATEAVFVAVAAVSFASFLVGGRVDAAALFGGSLGCLLAWRYAPPPREPWSFEPRRLGHGLLGIAALATGAAVILVVERTVVWFGLGLFAGALTVGLPRIAEVAVGEADARAGVVD